jgi:serine/threonine-protein kinase
MTPEGRTLADRYELGSMIGRGGMAEVYVATDRILQRSVAVKVLGGWLADDGTFVERFHREALAAAALSHPNLVAVFDAGSEDGLHYLVMELVPGETLADALARDGRLEPERAMAIARAVARALAVAHAAGIVHRDVKPGNVMLTSDGQVKLTDLGIARTLDGQDLTRTTSILGSPGYLSPEQARGERVDGRSDLYSLGCVVYEMLAGRPPFDGETPLAIAYQHVHEQPAPPSAFAPVPGRLDAVVMRAIAKDPGDRFQTADEIVAALDESSVPQALPSVAAAGATAPLPPVAPTQQLPGDRRRLPRSALPIVAAAIALAAVAAIAIALVGGRETGRRPGAATSPRRSASPSPSPSPSPEPAVTSVDDALAALAALVEDGLADGRISDHGAEDIEHRLEDAMKRYEEGKTDEAIAKLDELRAKIGEFVEHDEIDAATGERLDAAIGDLADAMATGGGGEEDGEG